MMNNNLELDKCALLILDRQYNFANLQGKAYVDGTEEIAELADSIVHDENVEIFNVGTAAIVSPLTSIKIDGVDYAPYTGDKAVMYRLKN